MPQRMQEHGRKHRTTVILDPDEAAYVEVRAQRDRCSNTTIIRRAIDLLMRLEPLPEELPSANGNRQEVEAAS